ncbi:MAG: glycosyltransferase family 39 protein [Desulfosarcinaceae bacterium]
MTHFNRIKALFSTPISWVFLAGFALRFYSGAARCVVNADAHHYIYQARVIYSGHWSELFSCGHAHISTYPFFTAMAFTLVRDWITAGLAVNILFGSAALVPLYFLLRRFLDDTASILCTLVFALMPTFVNTSGDIVRDPVFFFFIASGMFFFVRHWDEDAASGRFRYDLMLAGLCFVLATGTRIEGILFLAVSPLYLLFSRSAKKGAKLLYYAIPLFCVAALGAAFILRTGADATVALRMEKVWREATHFIKAYGLVDRRLEALIHQNKGLLGEFLHRTREALWIIPLAVLLHNSIEVFFYPFALLFFIGCIGLVRHIRQTPRSMYFLCLMLGAILVLEIHLVQTWVLIHRFMAILILPSCLVIGWGIENLINFLNDKWHRRRTTATALVLGFIVLTALPKSLIPRESDKSMYRQAARVIEETKSPLTAASIAAAGDSRALEWILLYSQRKYVQPVCAKEFILKIPKTYDQFLSAFDQSGRKYFIFEENHWPKNRFDFLSSVDPNDFSLMGQWGHHDSDRLMIFRRNVK